jgi:hypothetical protein
MARFILEYDVALESATKGWLLDNVKASMVSPNGDSVQFCLEDVIDTMYDLNFGSNDDSKYLKKLLWDEDVNYIEICF